jgi:hypothetical protein
MEAKARSVVHAAGRTETSGEDDGTREKWPLLILDGDPIWWLLAPRPMLPKTCPNKTLFYATQYSPESPTTLRQSGSWRLEAGGWRLDAVLSGGFS